jgi:hypothetical protein
MAKMDVAKKKCFTPEFRVSFPKVFRPEGMNGQEPKYSITMLFKKSTDLKELKRAVNNAIIETYGSLDKVPKKFTTPFRDGSEKEDVEGYENTIFVTASSKKKPGVVDYPDANPITEESEEFYPGCYARATLIAFTYDVNGKKGVSFALQNVQKLRDGKPLSGKRSAEDEFKDAPEVEESEERGNDYDSDDGDSMTAGGW